MFSAMISHYVGAGDMLHRFSSMHSRRVIVLSNSITRFEVHLVIRVVCDLVHRVVVLRDAVFSYFAPVLRGLWTDLRRSRIFFQLFCCILQYEVPFSTRYFWAIPILYNPLLVWTV